MAKPKAVRTPGIPAKPAGQSDVDAALQAGQQGKARQIPKARAAVPGSKVKGDPQRPAEAAVNAKKEVSYDAAMQMLADRNELDALKGLSAPTDEQKLRMAELSKTALQRSILTEKGWVTPPNPIPPRGARV